MVMIARRLISLVAEQVKHVQIRVLVSKFPTAEPGPPMKAYLALLEVGGYW